MNNYILVMIYSRVIPNDVHFNLWLQLKQFSSNGSNRHSQVAVGHGTK